jgi:hypothetical protein
MKATWKLAWAAVAALGFAALVEADPVAVSDEGRRAQAPEVAVGRDGSIHVIWLDKGAVGAADRKGKKMAGMQHSHQAFASLMYARHSARPSESTTEMVRSGVFPLVNPR